MMTGHRPDTLPRQGRRLGGATRAAWGLVLAMMLAAAAWSISGQLIRWGMDPHLAYALSLMFDAAGLLCAQYARRAVERGTPAGLARLALLAFVAVSAVINYQHGTVIGGWAAAVGLASIPVAVEALFELHRRDVRDEQRVARGLVAERLPHIPFIGWVMYPGKSWATLRHAVGARLELLDPIQLDPEADPDADTSADIDPENLRPIRPSVREAVRTAVAAGITDNARVLAYVRKVSDPAPDPETVGRYVRSFRRGAAS